jgi:hypothetical protein
MATGLGSMIAPALAQSLCQAAAPVFTVTVSNPGSQTGTVGRPFSLQISASDSGSAALTDTATGLPAGLAISPAGAIAGTPTTTGTSTVTVTAADKYGNTASTQFTLAVSAAPPTISGASLTGVAKRRAKLTFTVVAGSSGVSSLVVAAPAGLKFKAKGIRRGLKVIGPSGTASVSGRTLHIAFSSPASSATIQIGKKLLKTSRSTAHRARHKHPTVAVAVQITDASGAVTPVTLQLKE